MSLDTNVPFNGYIASAGQLDSPTEDIVASACSTLQRSDSKFKIWKRPKKWISTPSMSSLAKRSLTKLDLFNIPAEDLSADIPEASLVTSGKFVENRSCVSSTKPFEIRNSVPHDVLVKRKGRIQWDVSGREEP